MSLSLKNFASKSEQAGAAFSIVRTTNIKTSI
jgi:hypothetical protein